ncbi:SAM-dependent methyltransferase [Sneathiella limimaris]|uniref:SAM-dependent methyltransferase n=1 Tax=Sneathiella limimaris TaxID=1964213 RepID=UPI00146C4375|nr:cyclopropane-fatty-acyl-phospholipid synthase family protein [Sneathiella limimaris]
MLLRGLLRKFIQVGTLTVVWPDGTSTTYSQGLAGPTATMRLHDKNIASRLFLSPELALGEGYMEGRITVEEGDIYDLLDLLGRNYKLTGAGLGTVLHTFLEGIDLLFRGIHQYNPLDRSKSNVAHHYDLSGDLYELFLDEDRQYSCAYFPTGSEDLDTAQKEKKRHIVRKLLVEGGQSVLDIGSGWGGMGEFLAKSCNAKVYGVTLSEEQLSYSQNRVEKAGLSRDVSFHLQDYREIRGSFDRIVSVGMFEHVGVRHYREYFGKIHELLTEDGIALLHTIGRVGPPSTTSKWIRKYIFPGGYSPSLSEITTAIEKSGLVTTDVEVLRLHYAKTLRHWRKRFLANREKAVALYDEQFALMWDYYLAASEIAFHYMDHVVFQIQITKDQAAAPLTRDYLYKKENPHQTAIAS